jgi:cadmium resistance protein CadD (predicted permease)
VTAAGLLTAVLAFAGTAIDDLVILAALFLARRRTGTPSIVAIVLGQFAGFAGILAISLAAAAGLHPVPDRWIRLLGVVPIGMGGWGLWHQRGADRDQRRAPVSGLAGVALTTFANGADNITVFTPLFRGLHPAGSALVTLLFLALTAVWCVAGALLGGRHTGTDLLGRVAPWLVPAVFVAVGLLIVLGGGS